MRWIHGPVPRHMTTAAALLSPPLLLVLLLRRPRLDVLREGLGRLAKLPGSDCGHHLDVDVEDMRASGRGLNPLADSLSICSECVNAVHSTTHQDGRKGDEKFIEKESENVNRHADGWDVRLHAALRIGNALEHNGVLEGSSSIPCHRDHTNHLRMKGSAKSRPTAKAGTSYLIVAPVVSDRM